MLYIRKVFQENKNIPTGGIELDPVKYHSIADRYLDDVYRTVLGCCKNKENAEDAVQDTMLKLWNKREQWQQIEDDLRGQHCSFAYSRL